MNKPPAKIDLDDRAAFLALPYEQRQKIVVLEDELVAEAKAAAAPAELSSSDVGTLAAAGFWFGGVGAVLLPLAGLALTAVWNSLGGLQPLVLSRTQSKTLRLRLPEGHPQNKVLYIAHPLDSAVYYPIADFHHRLMLHKVNEAIEILKALRATSVEIRHHEGYAQEVSANVGVPTALLGASASAQAKVTRKSSSGVMWKASYAYPATQKPRRVLPRNLVWLPREEAWQTFVKDARKGMLKEFSLTVKHDNDFGVNGQLSSDVVRAKLELGGTFVEHRATEWLISARFDGGPAAAA